jgi:pimeloyl-ACP methyl ester carboxylesterase
VTHFVTAADGTTIAYDAVGDGLPVVLVHGFGANRAITWRNTGWYDWLGRRGRRVIALDCRGHGMSGKPHERDAYDDRRMLADVVAILDALGEEAADIVGYSMGGYLTINLLHEAPERVRRAVIGGVGETYFNFFERRAEVIAAGLLAADPATISDPLAREFRTFCERAGGDLVALAACMRRRRLSFTAAELQAVTQSVLIVCGEADAIAGRPEPLAQSFASARAVVVPRRNHHSTVGDPAFKAAVESFLDDAR